MSERCKVWPPYTAVERGQAEMSRYLLLGVVGEIEPG